MTWSFGRRLLRRRRVGAATPNRFSSRGHSAPTSTATARASSAIHTQLTGESLEGHAGEVPQEGGDDQRADAQDDRAAGNRLLRRSGPGRPLARLLQPVDDALEQALGPGELEGEHPEPDGDEQHPRPGDEREAEDDAGQQDDEAGDPERDSIGAAPLLVLLPAVPNALDHPPPSARFLRHERSVAWRIACPRCANWHAIWSAGGGAANESRSPPSWRRGGPLRGRWARSSASRRAASWPARCPGDAWRTRSTAPRAKCWAAGPAAC